MATKHHVKAQLWNGVLVEAYCFAPDQEVDLPKHSHDDYQIGLALTHAGEYFYRRSYHPVPVRSVSVIHPGEPHSGCGFRKRNDAIEFRSFYIPPPLIHRHLAERAGHEKSALPFVTPVTSNQKLERKLRSVYQGISSQKFDLESELLWNDVLCEIFILNGSRNKGSNPEPQKGVRRVREFLDAHPEQHVTLNELAQIANLTPSHLSRSFHQQLGSPLHRYQTHRRIDRAKRLLLQGRSPSEVALLAGFTHQSHFGKYFRELVQTSPAAYRQIAGETTKT